MPEFIRFGLARGVDPAAIEARLRDDKGHTIKAVCVVHNETSTGATSPIAEVRRAIDAAGIPRCSWSTPSRRSARSTTAMTSGASTSPSAARRRA